MPSFPGEQEGTAGVECGVNRRTSRLWGRERNPGGKTARKSTPRRRHHQGKSGVTTVVGETEVDSGRVTGEKYPRRSFGSQRGSVAVDGEMMGRHRQRCGQALHHRPADGKRRIVGAGMPLRLPVNRLTRRPVAGPSFPQDQAVNP